MVAQISSFSQNAKKLQEAGFWAGRGDSTIVESSLQIDPFYAKQSQFPKKSSRVTLDISRDYEKKSNWTLGENKPNQSQSTEAFQRLSWRPVGQPSSRLTARSIRSACRWFELTCPCLPEAAQCSAQSAQSN